MSILKKRRERAEQRARLAEAEAELGELRRRLADAKDLFNRSADEALIEASILELGALEARFRSALRRVRALSAAAERTEPACTHPAVHARA